MALEFTGDSGAFAFLQSRAILLFPRAAGIGRWTLRVRRPSVRVCPPQQQLTRLVQCGPHEGAVAGRVRGARNSGARGVARSPDHSAGNGQQRALVHSPRSVRAHAPLGAGLRAAPAAEPTVGRGECGPREEPAFWSESLGRGGSEQHASAQLLDCLARGLRSEVFIECLGQSFFLYSACIWSVSYGSHIQNSLWTLNYKSLFNILN